MVAESFEIRIIYDTQNRIEYVLKALPGTRSDSMKWQILKLFYFDATDNIIRVSYANNNATFQFRADDYLLYKYTPIYSTIITPLQGISAGFEFDLMQTYPEYEISGDVPDLLETRSLFETVNFITVYKNGIELDKKTEVIWTSQTSFTLNVSCFKDESILVES